MLFIETSIFTKQIKELVSDEEYRQLQQDLLVQPEPAAEVIAMPPKESEIIENKRIPVPEHVEPEPEKRGFWSRFFLPNG